VNLGVHSKTVLVEKVLKILQVKNALTIPTNLHISVVIYKNLEVGLGSWLYIQRKNNVHSNT